MILTIVAGEVTSIAGSGTAGYQDGIAANALVSSPEFITYYHKTGDMYIADRGSYRIRKISAEGESKCWVLLFIAFRSCNNGNRRTITGRYRWPSIDCDTMLSLGNYS